MIMNQTFVSYSYLLFGFFGIVLALIFTYSVYFSYMEMLYPARVLAQPDLVYADFIELSKMKEIKLEEETHYINLGNNDIESDSNNDRPTTAITVPTDGPDGGYDTERNPMIKYNQHSLIKQNSTKYNDND